MSIPHRLKIMMYLQLTIKRQVALLTSFLDNLSNDSLINSNPPTKIIYIYRRPLLRKLNDTNFANREFVARHNSYKIPFRVFYTAILRLIATNSNFLTLRQNANSLTQHHCRHFEKPVIFKTSFIIEP